MRRWVLTGPSGAGKSRVASLLAERGAAVIDGDALGHALLREAEVRREIRGAFGAGVFRADVVDRAALGAVVFSDPAALARLNTITLPRLAVRMRRALEDLARARRTPLAVLEAAVYFQLPSLGRIDLTIAVIADPALRLARLVSSTAVSEVVARQRIAAQRSLARLWQRADVTLVNDGSEIDLARAVTRLCVLHWPEGMPESPAEQGGDT